MFKILLGRCPLPILKARSMQRSLGVRFLVERQLVTNFDMECKLLRDTIDRLLPISTLNGVGFKGVSLTCAQGQAAIAALAQPEQSRIVTVPVDRRLSCKRMLQHSISRPGVVGRRDLLCTMSLPGSGKSVVLWFNAYWFVQKTKGIAVEITFNDDQAHLYSGYYVQTEHQLELAISVRILHRILSNLASREGVDKACLSDGAIVHVLLGLERPLDATLRVVRSLLGASEDTKMLLCVDELSKWINKDSGGFTNLDALKVLTYRLDTDESFFLAVSALRTQDLVKLTTDSSRHMILQALGPLWFAEGFDPAQRHLLPEAFRPFYDSDTRRMLPFHAEAVHLYDQLTQLLATAAGHPRRLEVLFRELGEFRASKSATAMSAESSCDEQRRAAAECFVDELALWLSRPAYAHRTKSNLDSITAKVETTVRLPVDYSDLLSLTISEEQLYRMPYEVLKESIGYAIEALAMYSATRFRMPDSSSDTELLKEVLLGVSLGFCQLVNAGTSMHHFFAFLPLPVLDGVRPVQLLPRGEALLDLRNAIRAMYKSKRGEGDKAHKDLQEVAVTSMLLIARCQYNFTLSQLCEPGNSDSLGVNLRGGPDVMLATVDRKTADETQGLTPPR
jgi:hypothetical protein